MAGMKDYVVEVLSEEETLPDEAIVLWVQHRHPNPAFVGLREPASAPTDARSSSDTMSSVASALCGANTPLWPPQSVIIRGAAKPTYLEFATSLSLQVGIPVDKLRIAKLATGNKKVLAALSMSLPYMMYVCWCCHR